jgi:hypothetical protein
MLTAISLTVIQIMSLYARVVLYLLQFHAELALQESRMGFNLYNPA